MKMLSNLDKYHIILASNSPRRKQLLAGLGIPFEVMVKQGIDEHYPATLPVTQVAEYIAREKAAAYVDHLADNDLLITADTIVVVGDEVLGKPVDEHQACQMLGKLSGRTHQVITGCCLITRSRSKIFSVSTDVVFKELTAQEIAYYVSAYKPLDKAGAYGIQEWIGYIGVTGLNGSYYNVMGLPVQRIYQELTLF